MSPDRPSRPDVLIIRHYKEKRSKCSLEPLFGKEGYHFVTWKPGKKIQLPRPHLLLEVGAPPLSPADRGQPLLLLDSTWRYLPGMRSAVQGEVLPRSFPPGFRTAYPRKSKLFDDPEPGLASIEALYLALRFLGFPDESLLDAYRWKEDFLRGIDDSLFQGSPTPPETL